MINAVFFGLKLEGLFLNLVYFEIVSTFGSTEPSSSIDHGNKQKILVQKRESERTFVKKGFSPSLPRFLCSSTPSSPSILRPKPPLLAVRQSFHPKLFP